MVENQKSGSIYALWYRLKGTCGVYDEWLDYDNFANWAKSESEGKVGNFRKIGEGKACSDNLIFLEKGQRVGKALKIGARYMLWRRYMEDGGVCKEWEDYDEFYKWTVKESAGKAGRFKKEQGLTATPTTVFFTDKEEYEHETSCRHLWNEWKHRAILCEDWRNYEVFREWYRNNRGEKYGKFVVNACGMASPNTVVYTPISESVVDKWVMSLWRKILSTKNYCPEWDCFDTFSTWAMELNAKFGSKPRQILAGCASPRTWGIFMYDLPCFKASNLGLVLEREAETRAEYISQIETRKKEDVLIEKAEKESAKKEGGIKFRTPVEMEEMYVAKSEIGR